MKKALLPSAALLMLVVVYLVVRSAPDNQTDLGLPKVVGHVKFGSDIDDECGQICSTEFDKQQPGRYYPLLRKRVNCRAIMWRMLHPPGVVHIPPLRTPPNGSIDDYTLHGKCPLGKPWYINNAKAPAHEVFYSNASFQSLLARDNAGKVITHYGDPKRRLKQTLVRYQQYIRNSHAAVVGTEMPWAEAMLINQGAGRITTLEYRELNIDYSRISTITPYKFADKFLNATKAGKKMDQFDVAFSFSSLEHSGLGRYGDPLAPYGDAEAVAQLWCAVRPGGLFFLGLPSFGNDEQRRTGCYIQWNAHRVYGYPRLQHVTANWEVVEEVNVQDGLHFIFVLRRLE